MFKLANTFVVASYLKYIDREINDHIDKVSKGKAGYQRVGAIPHTLVLVNDPEQSCIPHHPHSPAGRGQPQHTTCSSSQAKEQRD